MNTRVFCLTILSTQDATGYEIRKLSFSGKYSYFMGISYGSIYPMLNKLESEGLVTCRKEATVGKPDRKIYSITSLGMGELTDNMNSLPQYDKYQSEFLLLSLNANLSSRQFLDIAIEDQLKRVEEELVEIDNLLANCDDPAVIWVANYGKTMMQAKLEYYKNKKEELLELAGSNNLRIFGEKKVY